MPPEPNRSGQILLLDDEKNIRLTASAVLRRAGFEVTAVSTADEAIVHAASTRFSLVLVDYMLGGADGIDVIQQFQSIAPESPCVLMTAFGDVDVAVRALRAGAVDYMAKPFSAEELLHVVDRNIRTHVLAREVHALRDQVAAYGGAHRHGIVAQSPAMRNLLATATQLAKSKAPILIEGETGTGKECLAQFVHKMSPRATGPFVAVNCGALHPELLLSEMFGHKRGAFTGASDDRVGRFEAAHGGTLFLDEIGELNESGQVKLLRVLQEETFQRVGDNKVTRVDVRMIAATNRRLEDMVEVGTFRADLYYRLAVVPLLIPPLRQRPEDLMPLAEAFVQEFAAEAGRPELALPPGSSALLAQHRWPGNVRELRNALQRAVLLTPPHSPSVSIDMALMPPSSRHDHADDGSPHLLTQAENELWTMSALEQEYIRRLLARDDLKLQDVCRILGIDAATLYRKRKRYGL